MTRGTYQLSDSQTTGDIMDCITALSLDPATAALSAADITLLCQNPTQFDGETETISLLGGVDYQLFKDVSAFAQVSRTERFGDDAIDGFEENAITVGLTFDF